MASLNISYAMGTPDLPDIYTLSPRASGVYIRQTTRDHGITITYITNKTERFSFKSGSAMRVAKLINKDWPKVLQ